jgi:unsaturated chondroitin disaccharide hydrolase
VVERLISRIDRTLAEADGRYPQSADPRTGVWTWSLDWCSGYWPGLLRLAAQATGEERYATAAAVATRGLEPLVDAPTVLRGHVFWYGGGVEAGARALRAAFDERVGLIPPGARDAERYEWPSPGACVDGLPGVVPLLHAIGETDVALSHVRRHVELCVDDDGSVAQTATYDGRKRTVSGARGVWGRAQAWTLLGLAQAVPLAPDLRSTADSVATWWLEHLRGGIAPWDFGDPESPLDTSATAIGASALQQLGHTVDLGPLERHVTARGALVDAFYDAPAELIWGDYFLLEAALAVERGR